MFQLDYFILNPNLLHNYVAEGCIGSNIDRTTSITCTCLIVCNCVLGSASRSMASLQDWSFSFFL